MTPSEAVALARKQGHVVIIHKGQVFINSFDKAEVSSWAKAGARIEPHWDEEQIELRRKKGRHTTPAWEVHLLGACEKVLVEDADGNEVDVTRDALLAAAREKVPA